jgi:Lon protease-like protein
MSEPGGGPAGGRELPLFPLTTVLFPGSFLPLHVFEQRYRTMIRRCLSDSQPEFGVLLIKEGDEVLEPQEGVSGPGHPPVPYPVGTVARIVDARRLQEGRLLILCLGTERFRLRRLAQEQPYLVGEVEPLRDEDAPVADEAWAALTGAVRRGIGGLLDAVREAAPPGDLKRRLQLDALQRSVPSDPAELSFFVPRLLPGSSPEERQRLLDSPTLRQRLSLERRLLAREQQDVKRQPGAGNRLQVEAGIGTPSLN